MCEPLPPKRLLRRLPSSSATPAVTDDSRVADESVLSVGTKRAWVADAFAGEAAGGRLVFPVHCWPSHQRRPDFSVGSGNHPAGAACSLTSRPSEGEKRDSRRTNWLRRSSQMVSCTLSTVLTSFVNENSLRLPVGLERTRFQEGTQPTALTEGGWQ